MTTTIEIIVPGTPVPQARPRATTIQGHARVYSPTDPLHRASIRLAAAEAWKPNKIHDGLLRIDMEFVFPRPKRLTWKKRPMPRCPHASKPDKDNCEKFVLDALKSVIFLDDAQVFDGRTTKWYASGDESPHTRITITKFDGKENP